MLHRLLALASLFLLVICLLAITCLQYGCRTGQQTAITNYGTLTYSQALEKSPVSNSKETPFDVMRGVLQGAEVPIAAGPTPTASLTSTGKTQTYDNTGTAAPAASPAGTPNLPTGTAVTTPSAHIGGDGKTTPGATAPGG